MQDTIRITEVVPRDGLQNETGRVPTEDKAALVRAVAEAGPAEIEATSFVSPKWIPQLGDAEQLAALLANDPVQPTVSALVPNERGLERLFQTNQSLNRDIITKVSVFTAASETFSQKNTNATIEETLERFRPVIATAKQHNLATRAYISCAVACPYEGPIDPEKVTELTAQLLELGADEIDIADTIGHATPTTIAAAIMAAVEALEGRATNDRGEPALTLHLHDTFGRAAECVKTALDMGVRSFDASAAGIGGCPYASTDGGRAPGNIDTQLLVRTIEDAGFAHTINKPKLAEAAALATRLVMQARTQAEIEG